MGTAKLNMDDLDNLIAIVQKLNHIKVDKEKAIPIFCQMSKYKKSKGQIVSMVGEKNEHVYVLKSGIIRLFYIDAEGKEVTRFFGAEGSIGGAIEGYLPYAIEALENCEFFRIEHKKIKELFEGDIYWLKIWNILLQNSLQYKIYRESSFLTQSATERYLDFKKMYPAVEDRVRQSYIASYLGITPISLSRIRRTLK